MSNPKQELIRRTDLAITFTSEAEALKTEAIESAAMVVQVDSPLSQEFAVDAQKQCRRVLKLVEDARKEVKAPVIAFGKAIDDSAKDFVATVAKEELRIATLVGNFQQAEIAKAKSAEAVRVAELNKIEQAREEALAKANTLEEREQIREEHSQLTQAMQQVPAAAPVRVEGQRVEEVWDFEVVNAHLLANAHPLLVKIEPRRREVIELLKTGTTIQGIRAWKSTKASVRLDREPKAIAA